jgi:predicted MFS family arabinose efflux permease
MRNSDRRDCLDNADRKGANAQGGERTAAAGVMQLERDQIDDAASDATGFVRDRATWLAYFMLGYFAYVESSLGPLMPSLRAEFGISYTVASLHLSVFAAGSVLVGLAGERLARRRRRRTVFWVAAGGYTFGAVLLVASPVVVGTIAAALVLGVFGGFLLLTIQAHLSDLHGARRAIAIAESNVAASSCAVLAAVAVGGFERAGVGWRGAVVLALAGVAVLALRFRNVPMPRSLPAAAGRHGGGRGLPGTFWAAAAVLFLGVAAEWCVGYWGADFLDRKGGLGRATAAAAMSAYFVAMAIGRFAGSRLARRYADQLLLVVTFAVAAAGFVLLWLAPYPPLKLLGLFVTGLGIAGVYPFTVTVAMAVAPAAVDVVTARLVFSGAFAILLVPFVLGILADGVGIASAFGVTLPLLVVASVVATRLRVG